MKAKNKKYFCTGCPKVLSECVDKFFWKKFHRGIRNQKLGKVEKFQVWVVRKFLSKGPYRVNAFIKHYLACLIN